MNRPASWRALRGLAGGVLPVLAGLLLAPAGARAECGDYAVTHPRHGMASPSPGQELTGRHSPPAAPPLHKPCSGPHCSHAPAGPLPSAPATSPPTTQEWGCVLEGLVLVSLAPAARLSEQPSPRPTRISHRIFHPPRVAA
jgi:hypothetical protein